MVTPVLPIVLALQVAPALQTIPVRQVLQPRPIHHRNLAITVPKRKNNNVFDPFDHVYGLIRLKNLLKPTNY